MVGVQREYAPGSVCFGCGPANEQGLRIDSERGEGDELVLRFTPAPHHHAFPGVLNGGIIGTLLDCHAIWTAAMALMRAQGLAEPPSTVTAEFTVKMRKPTPLAPLIARARPVEIAGGRVWVEGDLGPAESGDVTARVRGLFVAVKPGHPAYHRW